MAKAKFIEHRPQRNEAGKYGYKNAKGKVMIPFEYDTPVGASKEFMIPTKNNKTGVLDWQGNIIIPFEYDTIYECNWNGTPCFKVEKEKKWGIIDRNNNIVLSIEYSDFKARYFTDLAYIMAVKNGKCGIIDFAEKIILPFEYEYLEEKLLRETFIAAKDEKWTLIDLYGNPIIPEIYNQFYTLLKSLKYEQLR